MKSINSFEKKASVLGMFAKETSEEIYCKSDIRKLRKDFLYHSKNGEYVFIQRLRRI
jgi:hypothetical protein